MDNTIKQITIDKLFGDKNIDWQLKHTNVLVGKNGMGKSTILQLIIGAISREDNFKKSKLCDQIHVMLSNDDIYAMQTQALSEEFKKVLEEVVEENPDFLQTLRSVANENDLSSYKLTQFLTLTPESKLKERIANHVPNEKLNFEFISTVNLNANSTQTVAFGNGEVQNILDLEIQNELQRLQKIQNTALNDRFMHSLNALFGESDKQVRLNSDFELEFQYKNDLLYFPQLSSGERQVIYILLKVAIATQNNALILMDEPEISLHLSWQEKLLTEIRNINPDSQIIIVTHSPAIVMNGWLDSFIDIQDIMVKG